MAKGVNFMMFGAGTTDLDEPDVQITPVADGILVCHCGRARYTPVISHITDTILKLNKIKPYINIPHHLSPSVPCPTKTA
jgi:hypothetical protein